MASFPVLGVGRTLTIAFGVKRTPLLVSSVLKRAKATAAPSSSSIHSEKDEVEVVDGGRQHGRDPLDTTFDSSYAAYKSKKTSEILRALLVLKLCSYNFLVMNHKKLIDFGRKVLGQRLFHTLMRATFFGHFVAGENDEEIKPVIEHLNSFGVKAILDYSAEEDLSEEQAVDADKSYHRDERVAMPQNGNGKAQAELKKYVPQEKFADRRKFKVTARTYFYLNEAQCEANTNTFLKCIDSVAGVTDHTGLAAIKLTALGRPDLLLQLSEVIARTRFFFKEVTGQEKMARGTVTPDEFKAKLDTRYHIKTDDLEVRKWLDGMDYDQRGMMNLFCWNGLVDMDCLISEMFKVPNIKTGKMERIISALSAEEEEMFRNMMRRVHTIARHASERDVRVMIDAEQTYFQPAISRITMELMRKYNKEKAIIFNTYQCYLKNSFDSIDLDLELARRQGFYFGAKLVRGAYMTQERLRAKEVGYEDPVHDSFENTSAMYHKCLGALMEKIVESGKPSDKISIMVASHNEDTVRHTIERMKELGIKPEHKVICFGQLYGMCDHISFPLGQSGYSVYKYVPYGPIDEVLPYLSRRAVENHDIIEKSKRERRLLMAELQRRVMSGSVFYVPKGNYKPV